MSSYWKKKLDELNEQNAKKSSSKTTKTTKATKNNDYWGQKLTELENAKKEKDEADIGPVRIPTSTTKKKDKDEGFDFFQKGGFEDGYQFGDVTKTILGTALDAGVGVVKGASKLVGGVIDAGTYGVAGIADAMGNDDFADRLRVKARENVIDKEFEATDKALDEYSLLGRTTDAIAEGLGQVGAIILTGGAAGAAGAGAIGATAATTGVMGVSSFGSGMSEAYQAGATDEEAATYGLVKGVVDAGSELLFGGLGKAVKAVGLSKGLTSLDDVLAQKISSKVTNQVTKNFIEYGVKASGEGLEEVIAEVGTAMAKSATYMSEKEWNELVSNDELLESFVVGAVTSGIAQSGVIPGMKGGSLIESNETGRDFISGLSENEQKVIDKEYKNRINEQEQDGRKLSEKEKSKIYDAVVSDMDKGYISTDTIEEVLGGDTYKTYKDTIDSEDELLREFEELGKKQNATLAEQSRYAELKEQVKEIHGNSQRGQLQSRLREEVMGLVQNDRLSESYNERTRRGQAFEADLTRYDPKQQSVIQKAVESGILNNTNRTHEFVDMIAKISADKGVLFDFANNAKLKESGFAVDGKTVNGFVTKDGVTLNIDSAKSLNSVVGHEITHILEGTDLYTALQSAVVEYAKTKGEYQGRYDSLTELYKNIEGANVDAELTADLVGDYLFTDSDFIHNLSTNHRNVFQKIYDEIKYLCKVATAGSKEARELEKVKRAFDKAYKADSKADGDTKYSLSDSDGKQLSAEQQEYFKDSKVRDENGNLLKVYHGSKNSGFNVFRYSEGVQTGTDYGEAFYFTSDRQKASGYSYDVTKDERVAQYKKEKDALRDKFLQTRSEEDKNAFLNYKLDGKDLYDLMGDESYLTEGGEVKEVYLNLTNPLIVDAGGKYYYEGYQDYFDRARENGNDGIIVKNVIDNPRGEARPIDTYIAFRPEQIKNTDNLNPTGDKDIRYSLSDSEGREINPAVQKRFGKSKVVDENGKLKAVYHGTATGEFSIFDKSKGSVEGDFGSGFYFTDNEADVSEHYEGGGPDFDNKVARLAEQIADEEEIDYDEAEELARERLFKGSHKFEVYLNIENPAIVGETMLLTSDSYYEQYNEEDYEDYEDYKGDVEQLISDDIDNIIWEVDRNVDFYDSSNLDGLRNILWEAVGEGGIGIEELKEKINGLYLDNENGELVGNEIARQVIEALGYDGIIDPTVSGKWNMDIEEGTSHYIVFKPNQIKAVTNQNPTDNPDIHLSMSGNDRRTFGNYNVYGKDIALAPTAEDSSTVAENATVSETESVAPVAVAENATTTHSPADLAEIAKGARREEMRGAYTQDGKQYLSDGSFVAEFNTVDEGLEQAKDFPAKLALKALDEAYERQLPGNYHLDTSGTTEGYVKVGDSLFDGKYINAIINAMENPVFSMSHVHGGSNALIVTGDNGRAVLMPVRAGDNVNIAYEAKPVDAAMFPDDLAPMSEDAGRFDSLTDEDAPPDTAAPYYGDEETETTVDDPFENRFMDEVGSPKVNAYMYENPEVKPFFQNEAAVMLRELQESTKGQRLYNDQLYYESGGEHGWMGQKRNTSDEIAYLLDGAWNAKGKGYTYAEIEKGLKAIIEDNGKENNACSKRIEFLLNDRLRDGYTDFRDGSEIPPDEGYLSLLEEKQITEYSKEAFDALVESGEEYAPPAMYDIGPDNESAPPSEPLLPNENEVGGTTRQNAKGQQKLFPDPEPSKPDVQQQMWPDKTARILPEEPKANKNQRGLWSMFKEYVLDNGMIFEDLSLKTGNRELQAKWHYIRNARAMAQSFMGKGKNGARALNDIRQTVENSGKMQQFSEYAYHLLNVDRMTLAQRYEGMENKPVFGDSVTAEMSARTAARLERANPEFRRWAQELYAINTQLREMLVEGGVLSRETANLWAEMYPHYIPIRRAGYEGAAINVALDTNRTGVNAPIKKATGGNRDILPMFDTMGQRTLQTYRAIAKNRFGLELRKTLGTTISEDTAGLDSVIDSMDNEEGLLTKGEHGKAPTFTVFENGKRYTFEITDEMYESMKPTSDLLSYTNPVANAASNAFRGVLTEYNPVFMMTNAMKDVQDIIMNSQHPARTYMSIPKAIGQMMGNGRYYREYMENGGEENTYFDGMENSFDTEEKGAKKLLGVWPLSWISKWNNRIERLPRMAEYIASREDGRSVEVSMLDAARVTTNFAAGGKLTKFANRNGATFLNASVQGAVQQARNVREAKANGLKGAIHLAAKVAIAGLPVMIFNHLMWDDDEEYEELSDYVKQNYYIVGKYGDGKFVRIPKGRTLAVIQNAFEQMKNLATGDDEADLKSFLELAIANLAPNNPVEDNIIAPIMQVKNNETWYGEDLVPTRLQDLPAAEQFDESTDAISKWLGEKLNVSPYKLNYLLNQYSGGVGDVALPFFTPEAERGENSLFAPLADKFSTDSVMNNQNVSDFYDTKDELTVNANASNAKDEDVLKSKYINAINSELSELYKQKREIQNSNKSDAQKYAEVYAVQSQIVELTRQALDAYENIERDGDYAKIGDMYFQWYTPEKGDSYWRKLSDEQKTKYLVTSAAGNANYATDGNVHYRREDDGSWTKISDRQLERQREVTEELGITPEEYWSETDISFMPMSDGEYEYAYDNPANYALAKSVGGYDAYKGYSKDLSAIKADKDKNGKSITGSRKEKVLEYINNLDADYYTKIILWKNEYNSDDTYNREIIEYLNGNDDISGDEMREILIKLGFTVDDNGNISW